MDPLEKAGWITIIIHVILVAIVLFFLIQDKKETYASCVAQAGIPYRNLCLTPDGRIIR